MDVTPKGDKLKTDRCLSYSSAESSPSEEFRKEKHPKPSSSLRERLKRTRRSFTSPLSVAKRLCVDSGEQGGHQASVETGSDPPVSVHNRDNAGSERLSGPTLVSSGDVAQLRKEVKEKTETLRRLKMVQMYRSKNDLTQLQTLIDKWRSGAQAALCELQSEVPVDGRKASLSELMDLFRLEDSILHFDRTEEDFTT
nr:swi5-dependent recombination DNA repair protein 1 homolog [Nothobranchius furzeri]XP_054606321.1 swi5-dependent recombination DNA repair protein 1 homolog [Nothobranchius furzeri]